jgi:dTDP-4-amino-4,6-dideoxygalactose transaminase
MNVGSEVYYPVPLHQQECFASLKENNVDLVETDRAAEEVLSLPIFPELTAAEQAYAVNCLAKILDVVEMPLKRAG